MVDAALVKTVEKADVAISLLPLAFRFRLLSMIFTKASRMDLQTDEQTPSQKCEDASERGMALSVTCIFYL